MKVDVGARIREIALAAREVGATRVRVGAIELELAPVHAVRSDVVETRTTAQTRERILFPGGRTRLPVAG